MKHFLQMCVCLLFLIGYSSNLMAQNDTLVTNVVDPTPSLTFLDDIQLMTLNKGKKSVGCVIVSNGANGIAPISFNGQEAKVSFMDGVGNYQIDSDRKGELLFISYQGKTKSKHKLYHISKSEKTGYRLVKIPLWLSLIPPLLAIILALIFKEVIISLFAGIWAGAFIAGGMRFTSILYYLQSFVDTLKKYIVTALSDTGHLSVIVFSLLIGGMVAIISKNGGMAGVVQWLSKYARSARSTQFITWLMGVAIFFDDYANTLIVGNTMRSVTDRFNISREKLAYIVDSTAAPVAAIAFITTWIGAELGYIDDGMSQLALGTDVSPYAVFFKSLKYSFYPVLTLIFILLLIYFKKDFGGMYKAEMRARTTGQVSPAKSKKEDEPDMEDLSPVKGAKLRWFNAVIPIAIVILTTMIGLVHTGMESLYQDLLENNSETPFSWSAVWSNMGGLIEADNPGFFTKLGKLIGASDSYVALLWASLLGVSSAVILTVSQGIMKLFDTMHWMSTGIKTMIPAIIILTLAWSLALTTEELHTADFLSAALQNAINPYLMPVIVFVLAALIAFSTGSSWSTMAILYPIVIPTTYAICVSNNMDPNITMELLYNTIATVLAASVLGDHCSPISDTTILSSLASDCNHIDHVKTQLPYALTVGVVSIICVGLSTFLGGGIIISIILLVLAVLTLAFIIKRFGKTVVD